MDLLPEELQLLSISEIVRESISIPKRSPRTFYLVTLSLIFPLSFAILAHSLFTHPLISQLQSPFDDPSQTSHEWTLLLIIQFCYLLFLFAFSLLSTAAVVFTVASLYTSKPVSFSSTLAAIPRVFRRLFITFLWVTLLMILYNSLILLSLLLLLVALDTQNSLLMLFAVLVILSLFLLAHVYITALWHLASVVSVLEPVYGLAAMKKSYHLLKGRIKYAAVLVSAYLFVCGLISGSFSAVVVHGGDDYAVFTRILVGGFLVGLLVIVNLVGLLVQSVFYYVCKSYHHQGIDKSALHDHLGGYLGEYVPLKSSIQMENMDIEPTWRAYCCHFLTCLLLIKNSSKKVARLFVNDIDGRMFFHSTNVSASDLVMLDKPFSDVSLDLRMFGSSWARARPNLTRVQDLITRQEDWLRTTLYQKNEQINQIGTLLQITN
ncbi:hypothetical protein CR513_30237, partial [Mucuna pruriens]